jgi:hypothetical protein
MAPITVVLAWLPGPTSPALTTLIKEAKSLTTGLP